MPWKRMKQWMEDTGGGLFGDLAVGTAFFSLYESGSRHMEVAYYVEEIDPGEYGVIEYNAYWIGDDADSADLTHDPVGVYHYHTIEEAEKFAKNKSDEDESYKLLPDPPPTINNPQLPRRD